VGSDEDGSDEDGSNIFTSDLLRLYTIIASL
jgi:hypothetical protein